LGVAPVNNVDNVDKSADSTAAVVRPVNSAARIDGPGAPRPHCGRRRGSSRMAC
jgi:hypothetical protein